jgi:hypothetical protein
MKQVILLLILGIIAPKLQAQVSNEDILGTSAEGVSEKLLKIGFNYNLIPSTSIVLIMSLCRSLVSYQLSN